MNKNIIIKKMLCLTVSAALVVNVIPFGNGTLVDNPVLAQGINLDDSSDEEGATEDTSGTESESKPDVELESKSGTESESETGTESESETGTESESEAGTESESEAGTESESETDKESESETGTESESGTDTESETDTEGETNTESETDTEGETNTENETSTESETYIEESSYDFSIENMEMVYDDETCEHDLELNCCRVVLKGKIILKFPDATELPTEEEKNDILKDYVLRITCENNEACAFSKCLKDAECENKDNYLVIKIEEEVHLEDVKSYSFSCGIHDGKDKSIKTTQITLEKIKQELIIKNAEDKIEEVYDYYYGDVVELNITTTNTINDVSCYWKYNSILYEPKTEFYKNEDDKDGYIFQKMMDEIGVYELTFKIEGNKYYEGLEKTITINVNKPKIEAEFIINDSKQESFTCYKGDSILIDFRLSSNNNEYLYNVCQSDEENITFNAVSEVDTDEIIELGKTRLKEKDGYISAELDVLDSSINKLDSGKNYKIMVTVACNEAICNYEYDNITDKTLKYEYNCFEVENLDLEIDKNEITYEYTEEPIVFTPAFYTHDGKNKVSNEKLKVTYQLLSGSDVIEIMTDNKECVGAGDKTEDEQNTIYITAKKAGTACIQITADDKGSDDIYNEYTIQRNITISSPKDVHYVFEVNGEKYESVDDLYKHADAVIEKDGETVHWYKEPVMVSIDKNQSYYDILEFKKNVQEVSVKEDDILTIDDGQSTDYKIQAVNYDLDLRSKEITLNNIAIDTAAPNINQQLILNNSDSKSSYSLKQIEYYNEPVKLQVQQGISEGGILANNGSIDTQSGVKTIRICYLKDNVWTSEELTNVDGYADKYEIDFNHKLYNSSRVKVEVLDNVGNKSEAYYVGTDVEIQPPYDENKLVYVCVDQCVPVVDVKVTAITENEKEKEYNGEWTNCQLKCTFDVLNAQDISSGIAKRQYKIVHQDKNNEKDEGEWIDLKDGENSIILGNPSSEYKIDAEKKGQILYEHTIKTQFGDNEEQKTDSFFMNAEIYFRVISNSDLESENAQKQAKICQQILEETKVYADKKPSETGWYNSETGEVTISLEYDEDDSEYGDAVSEWVNYELSSKYEDGKTATKSGFFEKNDSNNPSKAATISINQNSKNTLKVYTYDVAGNRTPTYSYEINADYTKPQVEGIYYDEVSQALHTQSDEAITYNVMSQNAINVTTSVEYGISEKNTLKLKECKNISDCNERGLVEGDSLNIGPSKRGFIYLVAEDGAGNKTETWANGFVTDNNKPKGIDGVEVTISAEGENEAGYFNKDVPVSISVTDNVGGDDYSGLKSVNYTIGYDDKETTSNEQIHSFAINNPTWSQIQDASEIISKSVIINATNNESNNAYIEVTAIDNSLNEVTTRKEYKIDITKPVIDIDFDINESNDKYFDRSRTAYISINEKNFDPSLVEIEVFKNGHKMPNITSKSIEWKNDGNYNHRASIGFTADGEYYIKIGCVDLADNEAEVVETERFIIDTTAPVITVDYGDALPENDNYFNTDIFMTVTVIDDNFDEQLVDITTVPAVEAKNWIHRGNKHTLSMDFKEDGYYKIKTSCMDLAGNKCETEVEQDFYIDTELPQIAISGIVNDSANAKDVFPVVLVTDENIDNANISIALSNGIGKSIVLENNVTVIENGYQYELMNVNGLEDNIYFLKVELTDMAGNNSQTEYSFSLNRKGSTYDLTKIQDVIDKVYLKYDDMEDLYITEMNIDVVEAFSIYVNRNNQLLNDNMKSAFPENPHSDTIYYKKDISGNKLTGYKYNYKLFRENFEKEGIYNIMLYSKDRAGNEANNTITETGDEISFVIDNTAPIVIVDGVDAEGFFADENTSINVYVTEHFKLNQAHFYLVDSYGTVLKTYDYMDLADAPGDIVSIKIPQEYKEKLYLNYSASDAAGNESVLINEVSVAMSEAAVSDSVISDVTHNDMPGELGNLQNNQTHKYGFLLVLVGVMIGVVSVSVIYRRKRRTN